ncbi:metallopeptidase family protein [Dermatophilus congolensis]|nr:metallopeptidase family protein [Dermatophilus congolensis]MBO3129051.1 metallopeptidase family protein [Dermatophilus congolensis]MBO3132312.1 metallopeptidase family protein [Dermatophilus congolensis]MBO3133527.1 metallopeptidase family protein [Dermatophilus congolensis]MBO3135761.1 metallopeptidase family protein [Dermatophilus congolensis]MBO3138000.1 metallopeptidase family protein [Dermatophilus congolensis]
MKSRSDRFDEAVLDALERIERRLGGHIENLEIAVELVPPSDPNPWEEQRVPLSRLFPPEQSLPGKIVLYRRPIETGLESPDDLRYVVFDLVVDQVADALGMDPLTLDPNRPRDWD